MPWADLPSDAPPRTHLTLQQRLSAIGQELVDIWPAFVGDGTQARRPRQATSSASLSRTPSYTLRLLSRATHFRQAAGIAFVFLLVTLTSIIWGQNIIESVMVSHVKEMVAAEIRTQQVLSSLSSAEHLAKTLTERDNLLQRRERIVAVQSASGQSLYGNPMLLGAAMCPADKANCEGWHRVRVMLNDGTSELFGQVVRLRDGGRYLVAYDILPMLDRMHPVPLTAGVSVFVVLLIALGAGLYFSLAGARRIDRIRQTMDHYARGNIDTRVALGSQEDEYTRLGENINQALQRINRLMEEVRNTTNHIAHELRTPLTRLQNQLNSAADSAADETTRQDIALAEAEVRRIQYLFKAIMRISEVESGRCAHDFEPIDIPALFQDLCEYYESYLEESGTRLVLSIDPQCTVEGDRALLFQALVNLVDNAIKYAPAGSELELIARRHRGHAEIGVGDHGPGIDASQRARAVQRFQRLSRDRSIPGHGLGLALVQAIAELHGGTFLLLDNPTPAASAEPSPRGLLAMLRLTRQASRTV